MRRCLYLAMLVALAALAFAPAAMAQQMGDDNMVSSASSSAMSSATSDDQMMGNGKIMSPSASPSIAAILPSTGGPPLRPLISAVALVLILSSGLLATTVVRRNS